MSRILYGNSHALHGSGFGGIPIIKGDLLLENSSYLLAEDGSNLAVQKAPAIPLNLSNKRGSQYIPMILNSFGLPFTLQPHGTIFKSNFNAQTYAGLNAEIAGPSSLVFDPDPLDASRKVAHFYLYQTDPIVNGKHRSELAHHALDVRYTYTYRWGVLFPNGYAQDVAWDTVAQWHNTSDPGEAFLSPSLAILLKNGHMWWNQRYDPHAITNPSNHPDPPGAILDPVDLGAYLTGVWLKFVLFIKWSYGDDGYHELWCNGQKLYSRSGPNWYNDQVGPYFKIGQYKFDWDDNPGLSLVSERDAYYSHMQIDYGNTVGPGY